MFDICSSDTQLMTLTSPNSLITFWADFNIGHLYHFYLLVQGFNFIKLFSCEWTRDQEIKRALRDHLRQEDIVRGVRNRVYQVREKKGDLLIGDVG